jgi:hypothetical protein
MIYIYIILHIAYMLVYTYTHNIGLILHIEINLYWIQIQLVFDASCHAKIKNIMQIHNLHLLFI